MRKTGYRQLNHEVDTLSSALQLAAAISPSNLPSSANFAPSEESTASSASSSAFAAASFSSSQVATESDAADAGSDSEDSNDENDENMHDYETDPEHEQALEEARQHQQQKRAEMREKARALGFLSRHGCKDVDGSFVPYPDDLE